MNQHCIVLLTSLFLLTLLTCMKSNLSSFEAWILIDMSFDYIQVQIIDFLPEMIPKLEVWIENVLLEEGNATILTLVACLLTVLYLRERQRRQFNGAHGEVNQQRRNEQGVLAPN